MKTSRLGLAFVPLLAACAGCPLTGGDGNGGGTQNYTAMLDGDQEVPPVETEGSGSATLARTGNVLDFDITASGLSGPLTAAHFHLAPAGQDGDVIFNLTDRVSEQNGNITISGQWTLTDAEVEELDAGNIYINLHTELFPDGEIRGQVEPDETQ